MRIVERMEKMASENQGQSQCAVSAQRTSAPSSHRSRGVAGGQWGSSKAADMVLDDGWESQGREKETESQGKQYRQGQKRRSGTPWRGRQVQDDVAMATVRTASAPWRPGDTGESGKRWGSPRGCPQHTHCLLSALWCSSLQTLDEELTPGQASTPA